MNVMMPGNPRYQPKSLQDYFGYDNLYQWIAMVELAVLRTLGEIGVIPSRDMELLTPELEVKILDIPTTDVDKVEREVTKHDIRAWVQIARSLLPQELARWIHVPLTSYDVIDTGRILQFKKAYEHVTKPCLHDVMWRFHELVISYKDQLQIGRTHGQHALPVTVGFWLATILSRILYNARKLELHAQELVGKISGAVGAYNAQVGLGYSKRCGGRTFEQRVLEKLGLMPAPISTQILTPDPLGYFLFSYVMLSSAFGQFGRDCRQLMRSEIGEVRESFDAGQVGSSTMAHKRNPINFENLEGTWIKTKNEFGKYFDTLISEHQRDLVGSSPARDFPTIVINVQLQLETLLRKDKNGVPFIARIAFDPEACKRNFQQSAHVILAEPLYIALQEAGYEGDAHELVNRVLVPKAQATGKSLEKMLTEEAETNSALSAVLKRIPTEKLFMLEEPESYIGNAPEKALEIAHLTSKFLHQHEAH